MTGLKLLADKVDARRCRARRPGMRQASAFRARSPMCAPICSRRRAAGGSPSAPLRSARAVAWVIIVVAVPRRRTSRSRGEAPALFDFRPVLRNRSAMAYAIAYGLHTLEMSALRGWGVAFLASVAAGTGATTGLLSPDATLTALGLIGTSPASPAMKRRSVSAVARWSARRSSDRSRSPHCSPRSVRAPTRSPLRSCCSTAR